MYSESELESAVAAGKLTKEAADALRSHVSDQRSTPNADEEQFRLITSFNDIFVALAGTLVLVAGGWIVSSISPYLAGPGVAAIAWGLSEFFTLKRRMALPSIIFVLAFAYAIYGTAALLLGVAGLPWMSGFGLGQPNSAAGHFAASLPSAAMVGGALLHWQRFKVPITIAICVGSLASFLFTLAIAVAPKLDQSLFILLMLIGFGVFTYALWWDRQDRERQTRKSDVAFWLHLVASPLIIHPIFLLLGINVGLSETDLSGGAMTAAAIIAILVYLIIGVVSLVIDRRAMLVSALIYVVAAVVTLMGSAGTKGLGIAFAGLIIGSGLLMLSALWQKLRNALVPLLPETWQAQLPTVNRE